LNKKQRKEEIEWRRTHSLEEKAFATRIGPDLSAHAKKIFVQKLDMFYGAKRALHGIDMEIKEKAVTALIGPSGCGKSTFLRTLNRMNDTIPGARVEGSVLIDGIDIYGPRVNVAVLRRMVGMVFQKQNPFPKSVFDNVAYGPRLHGFMIKRFLNISWRKPLKKRRSGTKSKTVCRKARLSFQEASSSGFASRVCSR